MKQIEAQLYFDLRTKILSIAIIGLGSTHTPPGLWNNIKDESCGGIVDSIYNELDQEND